MFFPFLLSALVFRVTSRNPQQLSTASLPLGCEMARKNKGGKGSGMTDRGSKERRERWGWGRERERERRRRKRRMRKKEKL